MLTLYRTLPQLALHYRHYFLRLTQTSQKILPLFVFSLAVKFPVVNVVFVTRDGVRYITLVDVVGSQTLSTNSFHLHLALYDFQFSFKFIFNFVFCGKPLENLSFFVWLFGKCKSAFVILR